LKTVAQPMARSTRRCAKNTPGKQRGEPLREAARQGRVARISTPCGPKRPTVYWVLKIAVFACAEARREVKRALSTQKGNALEYAVNFGAQTDPTVSFFPVCFPRPS